VYGVALCSTWHLVPFKIRRTLARLWDTSSSIPTPGGKPPNADLTVLLTGQQCMGHGYRGVQEYYMSSNSDTVICQDPVKGVRYTVS